MESDSENCVPQEECSNNVLCWQTWSAKRHPLVATIVVVFVLALTAGIHFSFDNFVYPVFALLVLGGAICPYYLPTRFTLDGKGITISSLLGQRQKPWSRLRTYFPNGDDGVLVSPINRQGLLSTTRGIYLPFVNNRESVLEYLHQHLPKG